MVFPLLHSSIPALSMATVNCIIKGNKDWLSAGPRSGGNWPLVPAEAGQAG